MAVYDTTAVAIVSTEADKRAIHRSSSGGFEPDPPGILLMEPLIRHNYCGGRRGSHHFKRSTYTVHWFFSWTTWRVFIAFGCASCLNSYAGLYSVQVLVISDGVYGGKSSTVNWKYYVLLVLLSLWTHFLKLLNSHMIKYVRDVYDCAYTVQPKVVE